MSKLSDLSSAAIAAVLGNMNYSAIATFAINLAGAATIKTTGAFAYTINGVKRARAAFAAQSLVVTHNAQSVASKGYVQPAGKTAYFTIGLDAAGGVAVVQGSYAGQKPGMDPYVGVGVAYNQGTSFVGSGAIPDVPAGFTAVAVMKVVTAGVATFTPGVTALDATNVTVSFFDVAVLPSGVL